MPFSFFLPVAALAGPPYVTDDPEPCEYQHWEIYGATHHVWDVNGVAGDLPHTEINYGMQPNMMLHVLAPLAYSVARTPGMRFGLSRANPFHYGIGDIELGIKLRLVNESEHVPMIGTFPLFEAPAGNAKQGLGAGHPQVFAPLWLQKSWGPWQTYGGGGYWFNPGKGQRDWQFAGWLLQRQIGMVTPGAELFFETPSAIGGRNDLRFNVGAVIDLSEHHHLLFSAGRSIVGPVRLENYTAYQLTI